jgi:hypothetical protein
MTPRRSRKPKKVGPERGRVKDPAEWVTGDEPLTGAQESYLQTLAREAGEQVEPELSKAEASERIDQLQRKTGRGT